VTNRSAVLHAPRQLSIEDRPVPEPAPGEVLVQVVAVGICGSDVHYYEHGRIGPYVVEAPMVIGHEAAGVVVGVGEGVSSERVGELVALEPGVPCRNCPTCLSGRYNLCPDVVFFATPPVDGAICEYVTLAAGFAHRAPAGLDPDQAAMAEPVSVGIWACRRSDVRAGDRVLVTGAGPIGLLTAQVARAFGARSVTVTDMNPYRVETAAQLGLRAQLASRPLEEEYDVLLECSGAAAALTNGLRTMARSGRVVLVGMGADDVSINVPLVQGRELTITGTFRYANTYPLALDLIAGGAVDVTPVITHHFDLDHTVDALTLATREPNSLKSIVRLS
jgi:L-iditol 2-dehydrogenase